MASQWNERQAVKMPVGRENKLKREGIGGWERRRRVVKCKLEEITRARAAGGGGGGGDALVQGSGLCGSADKQGGRGLEAGRHLRRVRDKVDMDERMDNVGGGGEWVSNR